MKKQEIWRELAQRELARRSFAEYLAYVQGRMWKRTRMAEFLAGRVQAFLETETGHAYDILLIETPPQHGKSMTVTESVPSWYLGKHPEARIIMASYNEDPEVREEPVRHRDRRCRPGDGAGAVKRRGAHHLARFAVRHYGQPGESHSDR